jgi:hypothetical protein
MKKTIKLTSAILGILFTIATCQPKKNSGIDPLIFLLIQGIVSGGSTINVSGVIKYEHIPVNTGTSTLNTAGKTERPARKITVKLLDNNSRTVTSVSTDETGAYTITGATVTTSTFTIVAAAEMVKTTTPTYSFKVVDTVTTSIGSTYAVSSASTQTSTCTSSCTINVTALDSNRGNGPFSILDVVYTAVTKVLGADANTTFPGLNIKWTSTSTTGSFFTTSSSTCGSGVTNCIVLLGNRSADSDEFDRHVIAHEFTHYLESALSRSDSIGGSHSTNDTLEPRIAYGEGLGNAMGAIFLDNSLYTDTTASGGFNINMETGTHTNVGFFAEASVHSVIWDLYDSVSDTKNSQSDSLSYPFSKIWAAVIALKSINSITYIHEFISALKTANASDTTAINNILTMESIAASEGAEGNVSKTSVGTSNTHTCDGSTAPYPYNPIIEVPGATTGNVVSAVAITGSQNCGIASYANNKLFGSKFYKVSPSNSGTMTVTAIDGAVGSEDPDVYITQLGVAVKTCNINISESCATSVTAGKVYIVEIRTYSPCAVSACATGNRENATITIALP